MNAPSSLPLPGSFTDDDTYVKSLLEYVTCSELHQKLCGQVHILDFFTRTPDLYESLLQSTWRDWFETCEIDEILDLIFREDVTSLLVSPSDTWRDKRRPPDSLLSYISQVRSLCLERGVATFSQSGGSSYMPPHIAIGMKEKKIHEVSRLATYIDRLTQRLDATAPHRPITHLVDFGSGQNYLGRTLASKPYSKRVIAVEGRAHNVEGARRKDVTAGLAPKNGVHRNKKVWRASKTAADDSKDSAHNKSVEIPDNPAGLDPGEEDPTIAFEERPVDGVGSVFHITQRLDDGDLTKVVDQATNNTRLPNLLVMSLHSCGNLSHHGLRSLLLNPKVSAVAIVGCCYNLLTERLSPSVCPQHLHRHASSNQRDPHGFPMSARLNNYSSPQSSDLGLHLNITARMMAVQAPNNWSSSDSSAFFTRHFFRALLQRIFLDRGAIDAPSASAESAGRSPAGSTIGGTPVIVGSLRKAHYQDFTSYVRGAVAKIASTASPTSYAPGHEVAAARVVEKMQGISDAEIEDYYERFKGRKKHLSVVWSLMAFSAQLIEAVIVVDRWLWLQEQTGVVAASWVEPVWDYSASPRNLIVVGVKKMDDGSDHVNDSQTVK